MAKKKQPRSKVSTGKTRKPEATSTAPSGNPGGAFPIVGIGASAGGFEAFVELLRPLPEHPGMAFVVVQHLDPTHGSLLPEILARTINLPVSEVTDGAVLETGHVYVIPANTSMVLEGGVLRLGARVITRGQHMPVDQFFQSLADERGNQSIGVILSGTASDGTEGCRAIKAAGGITFAQDEESAKFTGMPRSAIASGCIDFVMKPADIARELVRVVNHPYVAPPAQAAESPGLALGPSRDMGELLRLVADASGVDFSLYKQTTLQRRIRRRMVVHRMEKLSDYLRYIKQTPLELDELYKDILIHVTGFFRDPATFDALSVGVFPSLLKNRNLNESPIRIWVPGCSTGEEVYSIAIVLLEYLWQKQRALPLSSIGSKVVQIFATDISDTALDRGRSGLYSEAALADVSSQRRSQFFVKLDGGYQISKALREMCIFAKQNVAKDPPFSNLDLISCRNLLIYLGPALQKRIIPTFHYALKPDGYLMLGSSESLGAFSDHFTLTDKKQKIYKKKKSAPRLISYFAQPTDFPRRQPELQIHKNLPAGPSAEKEAERVLLHRFLPPSIVVNDQMEVIHVRGRTGAYLEVAEGHPTTSLAKMAREGLLVDLHAALNKARKTNAMVRAEGIEVRSNGGTIEVDLAVSPLRVEGAAGKFYLVVFQEADRKAAVAEEPHAKLTRKEGARGREAERLRRENSELKEQLRTLLEDHETTTEEFKSANEEVLSANEELQSTNEELETAKEELQSGNEELNTLNDELHNRNIELSTANNDLVNLLANVNLAIVMIGSDLRIRRFTPAAERLLNLISADVGRRVGEIRPNLKFDDLEQVVKEVLDSATVQQIDVQGKDGKWQQMRVRPYKTWDNKIDGAVISFQDIDVLKRSLDETRAYVNALIESADEAIVILDGELRVTLANDAFYRRFGVSPQQTEERMLYDLGSGQWNIPGLRDLLKKVAAEHTRVDNFAVQRDFPGLGERSLILNARSIKVEAGPAFILLTIEDVTEREQQMATVNTQAALLDLAHETVIVRDLDGIVSFWNHGAERMYGWSKEEALGKSKLQLLHPEFPKPLEEIDRDLMRTGFWEGELVHVRKDGERRIVEVRWALQRIGSGAPVVLEINTDITDRKRYEKNLQQLSTFLMRVQDEERRKIARDLHDSAGQQLVSLKLELAGLEKALRANSEERKLVSNAMKTVDDTSQQIRNLAQMLHPPLLDEAGLTSAMQWLADQYKKNEIKVTVASEMDAERLPQGLELALFRITQEALNNIHRHSGASKAAVQLQRLNGGVTLRISDNGKGFPPDLLTNMGDGRHRRGIGLLGMRERLAELGGRLEISSSSKGTVITAVVPQAAVGKGS
jgi:two-component system CheB/CheR fusion protein